MRGISKTAWDRRIYGRGTLMADPQVVRVSQHIRDCPGPKGRLLMQLLDSVHRDVNARANPTVAQRGKWSPAGVPFNCPGERRTYPNGLDFPHSLAEAVDLEQILAERVLITYLSNYNAAQRRPVLPSGPTSAAVQAPTESRPTASLVPFVVAPIPEDTGDSGNLHIWAELGTDWVVLDRSSATMGLR